ncbi:TPA: hypothetical protein ACF3IQ_000330 [Enterobacter hormaechei]|nr:hypothetical protein [Enterobacter hormaechei]
MKRFTVNEVLDYLDAEDIDLNKLRSTNGLTLYKEKLIFMYCSDLFSVNVLSKISWHTAATIKKVLGL